MTTRQAKNAKLVEMLVEIISEEEQKRIDVTERLDRHIQMCMGKHNAMGKRIHNLEVAIMHQSKNAVGCHIALG